MIKVNISENNSYNLLAQTQAPKNCTCYVCGVCIWCAIFPPAVGPALSVALAVTLNDEQKS